MNVNIGKNGASYYLWFKPSNESFQYINKDLTIHNKISNLDFLNSQQEAEELRKKYLEVEKCKPLDGVSIAYVPSCGYYIYDTAIKQYVGKDYKPHIYARSDGLSHYFSDLNDAVEIRKEYLRQNSSKGTTIVENKVENFQVEVFNCPEVAKALCDLAVANGFQFVVKEDFKVGWLVVKFDRNRVDWNCNKSQFYNYPVYTIEQAIKSLKQSPIKTETLEVGQPSQVAVTVSADGTISVETCSDVLQLSATEVDTIIAARIKVMEKIVTK